MYQRKSSISLFQLSVAMIFLQLLACAEDFETSLKSRCKSYESYVSGGNEKGNTPDSHMSREFLKAKMPNLETPNQRPEAEILKQTLELLEQQSCQVISRTEERQSFYYRCPVSGRSTSDQMNSSTQSVGTNSTDLKDTVLKYYKRNIIFKLVRVDQNQNHDSGKPKNSFFLNNEISI